MSTLTQFFGGGVKSVQTGYVNAPTLTAGSGEDTRHLNITVSAVDTSKTICFISGGASVSGQGIGGFLKSGGTNVAEVTWRLTSSTNLRVSSANAFDLWAFRYYLVEYN